MSVADLWVAADLGGPSGVYRYLNGDRARRVNSQSARCIERIARALGVPPDYFLEYRAWRLRDITCWNAALADEWYDAIVANARLLGYPDKPLDDRQ